MPAKYTLVLRKDMRKGAAEGSKLFYANAKAAGTCGMYELCDLISLSSTASPGDVRLILDSLIEVMKRSLGKGEVVQVGELGNFQLQFGSTGTTTKKEFNQALIKSKRIVFRPGKMLRDAISNYSFEKIPDPSDKEEGGGGTHYFRHYGGAEFSFLDFARLIRTGYHRAWSFSRQPEAYAKEIAYSPYISEQNGDNRESYRRNLVAITEKIVTLKDMYDWMRGRAA